MSEKKNHSGHLTSGRLLAKNTVWNLIGSSAPMFVAVFSIPILIRGLGKERFGMLTLACELIGYATLFDLGLGRALTQIVAKKLGQGEQRDVPSLAWTSLVLMTVLGFLGAAALVLLSPWLVHRALHMPVGLQGETLQCFYLLGISLPVVIVTSGLRGLLEAHQRFDLVSSLGVPLGVFSFTGPLLVLPFSRSLVPVVGILIIGRLLGCVAHLLLCLKVVPELGVRIRWHPANAVALLRFGGWMMVTNVVGPLMVTLDRFLIGAMLSMAAVTYYATPYEVVTKLWIIPDALLGVMFPAFSTSFVQDRSRAALLYVRSIKYVFLILFPIALLIVVLAQNGLRFWLGAEFAQHSVRVLQLLAVGVFINSLAQIPFTMLQGGGRPDLTAQLHLIELPFYLAALWLLIRSFGIEGAAIAWTVRVAIDALLLFGMAKRLLPSQKPVRARTALLSAMPLLILAFAPLLQGAIEKSIFLIGTVLCFALAMWFRILTPEERALAQGYR